MLDVPCVAKIRTLRTCGAIRARQGTRGLRPAAESGLPRIQLPAEVSIRRLQRGGPDQRPVELLVCKNVLFNAKALHDVVSASVSVYLRKLAHCGHGVFYAATHETRMPIQH